MTEPESSSAVLTPPPKTQCLGPTAGPQDIPRDDAGDFRIFLGPNSQLGSMGTLGHYEVLEIIGRGGFGIVLRAFDEKLQRHVAIKALDPALGNTSPARKSFLREARSAAKVRHENVVQIYAVEEHPLPYLVMEYIDGETLQHRLDSHGPLDASDIVTIGKQICEGLAAAHDQGLIHRDIKPANILLERGPALKVKLTDFGLARTADDASLSRSGVIVGTPLYMAPEQASAENIDHRADLFSLGSVLYAMASGRPPFRAPTTMGVMNRVVNDTPRPIRNVIPDVPEGLCSVIAQLHEKIPGARPDSARDVADSLSRCLEEPAASVEPVAPTWNRRRLAAVAAGVLVVFGLVAFLLKATGGKPKEVAVEPQPVVPAAAVPPKPGRVLNVWEKWIATLPAEEQIVEVGKRLKTLNPEFDLGTLKYRIANNCVVMLDLDPKAVRDISPIAGLPDLEELILFSTSTSSLLHDISPLRGLKLKKLEMAHNRIADLAPLEGMPLTILSVWSMDCADMSPLRGMKLEVLNCGDSPVKDLRPLEGMPLRFLCINLSQVTDLTPLKGMRIKELLMEYVPCTDLAPLAGLPLERLYLHGTKAADYNALRTLVHLNELKLDYVEQRDREMLKLLPSIKTINTKPAGEFLGN